MYIIYIFFTEIPKMGIFAKSEESGEMPRSVALHLGLHSLLKHVQKRSPEKEIQF